MSRPPGFRLLLVTDRKAGPLEEILGAAVDAGLRAFQLREKDLSAGELYELAWGLRKRFPELGCIVNDRADVAVATQAAGVHLPGTSLPAEAARRVVGAEMLVGVSTHTVQDVRAAVDGGADYVIFGPVFPTPGKDAVGLEELAEAVGAAGDVPVVAIGGITPERCQAVLERGARGVAAIRSIITAADPGKVVRQFSHALGGL